MLRFKLGFSQFGLVTFVTRNSCSKACKFVGFVMSQNEITNVVKRLIKTYAKVRVLGHPIHMHLLSKVC